MLGDDLRDALGHALPLDRPVQSNAHAVLSHELRALERPRPTVLDVGCGRGEGLDFVRSVLPEAYWLGVDIEQSAEVDERPLRPDAEFRSFDGIHIPVESDTIDLAYSQQVFEHVARPEPLLDDIARVLKPGGVFCGSVSQLEAFHSRSVGGFTAYGWRLAVERAGFHLISVRPGIDAGTLLLRRVVRRSQRFDRYWVQESPGNRLIDVLARARKLDAGQRNALKLMFAGQFTFVAQRPHA
ncbi:MAG: methyltransferase domain-containing protein [Solirubrobacteraceae bacterium]|nr:methyltransferase domain-containing protein [Patulibacter sp.]